jgi:hypothetical protein
MFSELKKILYGSQDQDLKKLATLIDGLDSKLDDQQKVNQLIEKAGGESVDLVKKVEDLLNNEITELLKNNLDKIEDSKEMQIVNELLGLFSNIKKEVNVWYENQGISHILLSPLNQSGGLYAEYTFKTGEDGGKGIDIQYEFQAFFELSKQLGKPISAVISLPGQKGGHWVLCYFIDEKNFLYVDPFGSSNTILEDIAIALNKKLYISSTKIQSDGNSCGPISTELAMHLQGKFFFNKDELLNILQQKANNLLGTVDILDILPGSLKRAAQTQNMDIIQEIRRKHTKMANGQDITNHPIMGIIQDFSNQRKKNQQFTFEQFANTEEFSGVIENLKQQIQSWEAQIGITNGNSHVSESRRDSSELSTPTLNEDLNNGQESINLKSINSIPAKESEIIKDLSDRDSIPVDRISPDSVLAESNESRENSPGLSSVDPNDKEEESMVGSNTVKKTNPVILEQKPTNKDRNKFITVSSFCLVTTIALYCGAFLSEKINNVSLIKNIFVIIATIACAGFLISAIFACAANPPNTSLSGSSADNEKSLNL